jgi:hypothetical protein
LKIVSFFLLGEGQNLLGDNKTEQEAKANQILNSLGINPQSKFLIIKEEELNKVVIKGADGFVVFPYCESRFTPLIRVADSKLPVIIVGEKDAFANALDTYEYLADHLNVEVAFTHKEVKTKLKVLEVEKWVKNAKICVFGLEDSKPEDLAWYKNPIGLGKLNIIRIRKQKVISNFKNAEMTKAKNLAKKWVSACEVKEPSFEDVVLSARVYLTLKNIIEETRSDAAYVLWCGQFTRIFGTKMCFAIAKIADDGVPIGCWKGENLLPMLILHAISHKPVFVCEAKARKGNIVELRHCFAPTKLTDSKPVLRKWRNLEHTVTGYCQLPKGEVTLLNCGIGDKIVVAKTEVLDCKDLGGNNCRMTISVQLENEEVIRKFVGKEFALVYGDYTKEAKAVAEKLGLKLL